MAVTAADVKLLAPEHAGVADATVSKWITFAGYQIDSATFGTRSDEAVTLWVAHKLTAMRGIVTQRKAGDVSESYSSPPGAGIGINVGEDFARTSYGQAFMTLRLQVLGCSAMSVS